MLIGHRDHDEVIGTQWEAPDHTAVADVERLKIEGPVSYLMQTTLAADVVLVLGSPNSASSVKPVESASRQDARSYLVEEAVTFAMPRQLRD